MEESEGKSAGMQFFINVRSGSTRRLAGLMSQDNLSTMNVFVDGPYGLPPRLENLDNCVLVAGMLPIPCFRAIDGSFFSGGTGVAFTLPLFLDMIGYVTPHRLNVFLSELT